MFEFVPEALVTVNQLRMWLTKQDTYPGRVRPVMTAVAIVSHCSLLSSLTQEVEFYDSTHGKISVVLLQWFIFNKKKIKISEFVDISVYGY